MQATHTITQLVVSKNIEDIIINLQNASLTVFQLLYDKQMKANPDKCHSICSTDDKVNIIFENQKINSSLYEKLLGVRFDSKLTFDASTICFVGSGQFEAKLLKKQNRWKLHIFIGSI